jgi:hypothetical protein
MTRRPLALRSRLSLRSPPPARPAAFAWLDRPADLRIAVRQRGELSQKLGPAGCAPDMAVVCCTDGNALVHPLRVLAGAGSDLGRRPRLDGIQALALSPDS